MLQSTHSHTKKLSLTPPPSYGAIMVQRAAPLNVSTFLVSSSCIHKEWPSLQKKTNSKKFFVWNWEKSSICWNVKYFKFYRYSLNKLII